LLRKIEKTKRIRGTDLFIFFSLPPGWKVSSELTVKISRLAVRSRVFPLYEIEDGTSYTFKRISCRPIKEYFETSGPFQHMDGLRMEVDSKKRGENMGEVTEEGFMK